MARRFGWGSLAALAWPKSSMLTKRDYVWIYLLLIAGTLLAWIPLLGRSLPVADDFAIMKLIKHAGLLGYLHSRGFWRPLGQYPPFVLLLRNPIYPPVLTILTHLSATILLFHFAHSLFQEVALPLLAALIFAVVPFGYEALTWVIAYNYIILVPLFLANLILLTRYSEQKISAPAAFIGSVTLALLSALSNESLLIATVCSGLFVWATRADKVSALSSEKLKVACAPLVGCVVWLSLFYGFKAPDTPKHIDKINVATVISVYYRQYSLADIFTAWRCAACRHLVFSGWSKMTTVTLLLCAGLFLFALGRVRPILRSERPLPGETLYTLVALLALLLGASMVYAVGGGFSVDSRKKYPLVVLMLLVLCWVCRAAMKNRRISPRFLTVLMLAICFVSVPTTWLMVGIWKDQTALYNSLADVIVHKRLTGNVSVQWDPDLCREWPQMSRTLGYRFDDTWVLDLAVSYRGGGEISVTGTDPSKAIRYDPQTSAWRLAP